MNNPAWQAFLTAADRYACALYGTATEKTRAELQTARDALYPAARREVQARRDREEGRK